MSPLQMRGFYWEHRGEWKLNRTAVRVLPKSTVLPFAHDMQELSCRQITREINLSAAVTAVIAN